MTTETSQTQTKTYLAVFFALAMLTLATVGASYLHLARPAAISLGILIAAVKVSLIVAFFMHFKREKIEIHAVFYAALFLALILLFFILPDLGWK